MSFDIHEDPNYEGLARLVRDRECIAFIGSGLSTGLYMGWDELIRKLGEACDVTVPDGAIGIDDLLSLADEAHDKNQVEYLRVLSDEFGRQNVTTRMAYQLLFQLPFKSYITPNFDPLLALASRAVAAENPMIFLFPSLPAMRLNGKNVFYIHGYVEKGTIVRNGQLILGKKDFAGAYEQGLGGFLQQVFTYESLFFVGCTLREPAIEITFEKAREIRKLIETQHSVHAPPRYILLPIEFRPGPNGSSARTAMSRDRNDEFESSQDRRFGEMGITVVRYDPVDAQYSGIEMILEKWNELSAVKSASPFHGGDHP